MLLGQIHHFQGIKLPLLDYIVSYPLERWPRAMLACQSRVRAWRVVIFAPYIFPRPNKFVLTARARYILALKRMTSDCYFTRSRRDLHTLNICCCLPFFLFFIFNGVVDIEKVTVRTVGKRRRFKGFGTVICIAATDVSPTLKGRGWAGQGLESSELRALWQDRQCRKALQAAEPNSLGLRKGDSRRNRMRAKDPSASS